MSTTNYSVIQTFYIDSSALNFAATIGLTSVGLWFKKQPDATKNASGIYKPGVSLWLCEVVNDQPNLDQTVPGSLTRLNYDSISAFADAGGGSYFKFDQRVTVKTDTFYGIVVKYDDPGYQLWTNRTGDKLVGTNTPSIGQTGWIGSKTWDGKYYEGNMQNGLISISDTDLKFAIIGSKYVSNTVTIEIVNKDYEFLTVNNYTGTFKGGERVYQNSVSSAAGTININAGNTVLVGNGTNFTNILLNSYITVFNGSNVNILLVDNVVNTTYLSVTTAPNFSNTASTFKIAPVASIYQVDKLDKTVKLSDSTANSTNKFAAGNTFYGEVSGASATIVSVDDLKVDDFIPFFQLNIPPAGQLSVQYKMCYDNGSSFVLPSAFDNLSLGIQNKPTGYSAVMRSRSLEVDSPNLYGTNRKSSVQKIVMTIAQSNTALYETPHFDVSSLGINLRKNDISNTYITTVSGVDYDTEVGNAGSALSKHISKKVTFANNRFAEDVRVFLTGYRPSGTDIRVYCKVHNSADNDSFDDKSWTPLTCYDNAGKYSSTTDQSDLIEYTFGLPTFSETANTLDGTFKTELSNNVVLGFGVTPNTYLSTNDLVKIYNPLIPENYMVSVVSSANSTAVVLGETVSNNNIVGSGFKLDKLKYPNIAFTNPLNYNVSKYYNSSFSEFDKFDSMQVKIVLLANQTNIVPKVDTIQVIGVSA